MGRSGLVVSASEYDRLRSLHGKRLGRSSVLGSPASQQARQLLSKAHAS